MFVIDNVHSTLFITEPLTFSHPNKTDLYNHTFIWEVSSHGTDKQVKDVSTPLSVVVENVSQHFHAAWPQLVMLLPFKNVGQVMAWQRKGGPCLFG